MNCRRNARKDAADFLDRVKAGKVYGALLKTGYNELQNIESQNHYSARFNRYFMWMADTVQAPVHDKTQISVWDVNANRKIAGFSAISDDIGAKAKICWVLKPDYLNRFEFGNNVEDRDLYATRGEQVGGRAFWPKWNALIKPYMQDSD